jgi:hypothetical protein
MNIIASCLMCESQALKLEGEQMKRGRECGE